MKRIGSNRGVLVAAAYAGAAVTVAFGALQLSVTRGEAITTVVSAYAAQGPTFGQLVAAVNRQAPHIARLNSMTDLQPTGVQLVDVATLLTPGNQQALQTAQARNAQSQAEMRSAVSRNAVITGLLRERGVSAENVVAIDIAANGMVWVFYTRESGGKPY